MGKRDKKEKRFQDREDTRIGRLDEHTLGYYRRVSDALQEGFENDEDKAAMLENVFRQMATEALRVSRNQTVSCIVEALLAEATPPQIVMLLNAFAKDWELACTDRFASHVTQTLVTQASRMFSEDVNLSAMDWDDITENPKSLGDLITELHAHLIVNTAVHMQHTYASHIVRVVLEVLSGTQVSESVLRSRMSRQQTIRGTKEVRVNKPELPEGFKPMLKSLTQKILTMNKLKDLAQNALSSPVLQTVLLVSQSRGSKSCRKSCELLIEGTSMFAAPDTAPPSGDTLTRLPELLTHEVGSHLVEQVIQVAPDDLYASLLDEHLAPHILTMSLHPIANFILQRLIVCARTQEQFEQIYSGLYKHLEDVLAHNRPYVIIRLAEGCLKFGTKQEKFIKALMKTFHCFSPPERHLKVFPLLASLTTYDVFYKIPDVDSDSDDKDDSDREEEPEISIPVLTKVSLHGAVLLQKLLHFGNPRMLTSSLLDMKGVALRNLARDPHGSYVYDALVQSRSVGEKTREQLVNKMKGQWVDLACSKSGSRVLDSLWSVASIKQKHSVAEELCKHEHRLRGDHFGRFAWRNCALQHYGTRKQEWLNIQQGAAKKRKLFDDIIGGGKKPKTESEDKDVGSRSAVDDAFDSKESYPSIQTSPGNRDVNSNRTHEEQQHKPLFERKHTFQSKTIQPDSKGKRKHKGKK